MGRRGGRSSQNHKGGSPKANGGESGNDRSSAAFVDAQETQHQLGDVPNNLTSNSTGSTSMSSRQEWAKAVAPSGPASPRLPPLTPSAGTAQPLLSLHSPKNREGDQHPQLARLSPAASTSQLQVQSVIINPPVVHRQHSREEGGASEPFSPRSARGAAPPFNRLIPNRQGEAMAASLQEIFRAVQSTLPKVESAFATCHGGADFVDNYLGSIMDGPNNNSADDDEEEMQQMRRLGSWSTVETMATSASLSDLGSSFSTAGPFDGGRGGTGTGTGPGGIRDDDGQLIDPMLLERRRRAKIEGRRAAAAASAASGVPKTSSSAKPRRRRVVQFEYPPVSSLRQCPRVDPDDLPSLFFTEEELEVFEHDRESTYTADDIEIVAISEGNSPSDSNPRNRNGGVGDDEDIGGSRWPSDQQVREPPSGFGAGNSHLPNASHLPSSPMMNRTSSSGGGFGGLGNYISTPRVLWNKKRQGKGGDDAALLRSTAGKGQDLGSPRAATASGRAGWSNGPGSASSSSSGLPPSTSVASPTGKAPRPERLIKSVQIFLRERSAG